MWNLSSCDCQCNKPYKFNEYLNIKNRACEKILTGKLVLECDDEILNPCEIFVHDKKVAFASNWFIHSIS